MCVLLFRLVQILQNRKCANIQAGEAAAVEAHVVFHEAEGHGCLGV